MDGGAGNDEIESGGLLLGSEGDDRLSSGIANDISVRQEGGPGNDVDHDRLDAGRHHTDRSVRGEKSARAGALTVTCQTRLRDE